MKVIKTGRVKNKQFRLIHKSYAIEPHEDSLNEYIEWDEYKVQIKVLWFWITIKRFDATSDEDLCYGMFYDSLIDRDRYKPLALIEAEELYDAIVNPYKII